MGKMARDILHFILLYVEMNRLPQITGIKANKRWIVVIVLAAMSPPGSIGNASSKGRTSAVDSCKKQHYQHLNRDPSY